MNWALLAAISVYSIFGFTYLRAALNGAPSLCRLAFVTRKICMLLLFFYAINEADWLLFVFFIYAIAAFWGWYISGKEAKRAGRKRAGFARMLGE